MPITPGSPESSSIASFLEEQPFAPEPSPSEVFDHVVNNVLNIRSTDHPIRLAIRSNFMYNTVTDFQLFTDEQFKDMSYPSNVSTRVLPLLPGASQLLIKFKQFMKVLQKNQGGVLSNRQWLDITHEDFITYIQTPEVLDPDAALVSRSRIHN